MGISKFDRERWALTALLVIHILLGVYYSIAIPIWEAHDEDGHYYFVRHIASEHNLPSPDEKSPSLFDESHQPPLYYILAAIPVSFVDVNDGVNPKLNPYVFWTFEQGGRNRVVHDPVAEAWPYQGTYFAIHLARWVSVLIGALGLLFTYWTARLLAPEQLWVRWGAVLVLAFWPQYRFSTAVINNDIMVAVAAAAVMWLLVRAIVVQPLRAPTLVGLGAATGLALLSKGNALALLPIVVVVLVGSVAAAGRRAWKLLGWLLGAAIVGAAVVAWWLVHNVSGGAGLLGSARDLKFVRLVAGILFIYGGWDKILPILQRGLYSMWATFGWANVYPPKPTYWAAGIWGAMATLGLVLWFVRRPSRRSVLGAAALLAASGSIIAAAVLLWIEEGQTDLTGRYLLPALPALAVLASVGWSTILPKRVRPAGWALMGSALALLAALIPVLYIGPAYAAPRPLGEEQTASYTPLHASFGDFAELVGYRIDNPFVDPGGMLHLNLLWRAGERTPVDHTLAVQVFEGEHTLVGEAHRFPGDGAYATTTWPPGILFAEDVAIPVRSKEKEGHLAWVEVSFYRTSDVSPVPVTDGSGRPMGASLRIGRLKVRGETQPSAAPVGGLQFGPSIRLTGGQAEVELVGDTPQLAVDFDWAAAGRQSADYTISLQLRDAQQGIAAQRDRQPQDGRYPTSFWEAGEAITDQHALPLPPDLPAGVYTLYACMYDLRSSQRLPVSEPGGQPLQNEEVPLLSLTVAHGNLEIHSTSLVRVLDGREGQ